MALLEPHGVDERLPELVRHARLDLHPHDLAEASLVQLRLDCLQQILGVVADREVGIAGDAEEPVRQDLHPREEPVQMMGDDVLERDEAGRLP